MRIAFAFLLLGCVLVGCAARPPAPAATPRVDAATVASPPTTAQPVANPASTATPDAFFASDGGGEPRTPGYWQVWNTCAPGNQATTARANGGRAAGWTLVDDLLADPGIWLGPVKVQTCDQALGLLNGRSLDEREVPGDPTYPLVAELLTAQLNLETGAESCLAAVQAVLGTHALLKDVRFDGRNVTSTLAGPTTQRGDAEVFLTSLHLYNRGELCR